MDCGGVKVEFLGHSGFLITNGKKIAIDPYHVSSHVGKVDYILLTHSHYDHCSIKDIQQLSKPGTVIIATPDSQSKVTRVKGVQLEPLECGDELDVGDFKVEAVPAYNLKKAFHPKNEAWVGYILKFGDVVIYHAGDTDRIPEMQKLSGYGKHGSYFVTLLPVSGDTVMDADEAASVVELLKPDMAIPMHYGSGVVGTSEDAQRFADLCGEQGIRAEILPRL